MSEITITEIDEVVNAINEDIYNITNPFLKKHIEEYGNLLDFISDGNSTVIRFLDVHIWSSEDDPREWDEELMMYKVGLYDFIKQEVKRIISTFEDIAKVEW